MLGFERRVALRFLREGRMQSLLIVVGVAAGVAVVAYISALISGLQASTLEKTLGAQPHLSLSAPDDRLAAPQLMDGAASGSTLLVRPQPRAQRLRSIANWQALLPQLAARPGVVAASPMVSGAALALRGEASRSVVISGVLLERYARIVNLPAKRVAGVLSLAPGEAILGRELAADLGLAPGDLFTLAAGSAGDTLRVAALVDLGARELNRRTVLVPLALAQSLFGLPGGATTLDLSLADPWAAQALVQTLRRETGLDVESWQDTNAQLVSALNAQTISTTLIRVVVMVVVVLGIASVLVVSVVQKRREIGILRAMGATRGQVMRVFLLQGALVGAVGSALGVLLAALLVKLFTLVVRGSDGLPLFSLSLAPDLALQVALLATACGVLAAVAPARSAAQLDPAQAIRQ